ncbi:gasdermin-E [Ochotona princeps]|uniref:gasdermin-E n=1 Tax=Ochotona princeps TaxID=9978 RepID=UPI00271450A3|nr:gasdermin-E [Ochotona princeps]
MFAKATRNFLKEVDAGGDLIAVSKLNDAEGLQLLSLVTKRKGYWFWQKPKYQPLSLTLGDVLSDADFPGPVVVESDFVKYEGKYENHLRGSVETALGKIQLNAQGRGVVERQSSFGTLRKQEADLQQLIRNSVDRKLKLSHSLLRYLLAKRSEVLCVLTQRIMTTQKCVISEHIQVEETCGGALGTHAKTVQVSASEDGNFVKDSNVVLEIPAATTIAYGVIELYVKLDGQFEFCLLHGKHGGFERESHKDPVHLDPVVFQDFVFTDAPDGSHGASLLDELLSTVHQATQQSEKNFRPFEVLPEDRRSALWGVMHSLLFDKELLAALEQVCDSVVGGVWPPLGLQSVVAGLKPLQQQELEAFLSLVGCRIQGGNPSTGSEVSDPQLFVTAHFLVSALAEMPEDAAALLGTCCELQTVPVLCYLLCTLSDKGVSDLGDPALAALVDADRFAVVQRLFALADIDLQRLQSSVRGVILKDPHIFPVVLSISLSGLCALSRGQ